MKKVGSIKKDGAKFRVMIVGGWSKRTFRTRMAAIRFSKKLCRFWHIDCPVSL